MKKILLICLCVICFGPLAKAQFSVPDSVKVLVNSAATFDVNFNNTTGGNLTIKWQVTACDFPADWRAVLNICDNITCYTNSGSQPLWNGTAGNVFTSAPFAPGVDSTSMHIPNGYTNVTAGTHYLVLNMKDNTSSYNKNVVFLIYRPTTGVTTIIKSEDYVVLYPNPAINELNVLFSENAGIKNIGIYDIIGKAINTYKVAGNSARLDVGSMPAGVYFIRLINTQGNIVATRKFNKQ